MGVALLSPYVAVEHSEACAWPGFFTAKSARDAKKTNTARA
jgi:hypothetical protein